MSGEVRQEFEQRELGVVTSWIAIMAFKGAWHRGDGNGGTGSSSGDRRYGSSGDSFQSFGLPPQGVPGNQMNLAPMNYQTNPNNMYSVMNSGQSMLPSTNYSSATKSLPYTGTVSNMFRDYGVIDNEISFKLNAVSGPLPRVGDHVVCQMKPTEGFANQMPYKYYGFDVRVVQTPNDTRRPQRPVGGGGGGPQAMSRNSDSYINRNPNRNQSSNIKRSLPTNNNTNNNNNNNNVDHHHHPYGNNNRDRHGPANNGSHSNDRRRSDSTRRSRSHTNKAITPKRSSRAPPPKYTCTLPKASLDCSELNVTQIRSRYSRLHIPSDFYHASYTWQQSVPLDHPIKFITPCSFHVFNKNVPRLSTDIVSVLDPSDADYSWNVRVMLMSSPDIQTLISRSCLVNNGNGKTSLTINPDDLEHPTKLIKFLVGVRHQNEYFPLGGSWSESLDGSNPDTDHQVLIRTAIRCVRAQTGIDLSKCIQWCRYLEVRYHRPEEIHKGRLIESRVENIIVFLPDIAAACMPSSLDWEETISKYKQTCDEEIAEELNEVNISDENVEAPSASHHAAVDVENLRVLDLKAELKARGQPVSGIKVDLKKRLTKILQQEKIDEEKATAAAAAATTTTSTTESNEEEQPSTTAPETTTSSIKTEIKEHNQADIDKIRKDIESKYQLPSHRSILVHPTTAKGDKFDCRVVSLHYLLNYANKDTIKEKCFELYLFSEAFSEMLMRDYSYNIYRSLYSCLEVTDTNVEPEPTTITTEQNNEQETNNETKEEQVESMITSNEDIAVPELDANIEENEKKRKRTPSQDDSSDHHKKPAQEETNEKNTDENHKSSTTAIQTCQRTIHPELLLAFTFFDRNRCGYLTEKDLEEILLLSGLSLTKNEAKMFVSRIAHNEKVQYHKLTDKALPTDDNNPTNHIEINETDIDSLAPKGNLLLLPHHMSVFGIRSSTINENQLTTSVDNQRAMKQLEMSNKIQTGLELKIDTLKKEIQKLTDDLHSTQKSSRSYSDQLSDTKKRLRDTQHDLKELEEKYKRYSDALYRARGESRTLFDHITHTLGIKEKQPSQTRKSEDDTKKTIGTKTSNETDKPKTTEKPAEEEQATKIEETVPSEVTQ
ncbi:hypothetical protein I4U23_029271 [Adineta vaga]|nr:hypothetical protein I4U23_029271 [Adineta vaga]